MYSSLLDSVKNTKSNESNFIRAEDFLLRSILEGKRPTLTLSQAIDSSVILSIAQNPEQGPYFLRAIENGYIRISLYGKVNSLQGYLLNTLKRNSDSNSLQFIFSSMPFLYESLYTDNDRNNIFSALIEQIRDGNPEIDNKVIDRVNKTHLDNYVETIRRINSAARKSYINARQEEKQLKDVIDSRIKVCLETITGNEELKKLLLFIQGNCLSNYRTFYYDLLKRVENYAPFIIEQAKELIDYCYNEVVASTIDDHEDANNNILNKYPEIAASTIQFPNTQTLSTNEISLTDERKEYMTWERLLIVMSEVENLQTNKKCSWKEALEIYVTRQRLLPFTLGAKYFGITTLTLAISSVPVLGNIVANSVTELIWSSMCDAFADTMRKPSFRDIVRLSKESEKRCKMLKTAISQTSVNINTNCKTDNF